MASRVRIAAAACVVAVGLFVGSASATMAFADSGSGTTGETGVAQANGAQGAGSAPAADVGPGTLPEDAADAIPTTEAAVPIAATAAMPKPTSNVGDGRNGLTSTASSSKQFERRRRMPSQTMPTPAGETHAPEADSTTTRTTTPGAPSLAAEDPEEPTRHEPGFGWPWWGGPCPDPDDPDDPGGPGLPPGNGSVGSGGGGGGAQPKPPSGRPDLPPAMQLPLPREVPPQLPNISVDPLVDAVTGLVTAAAEVPFAPITLPVVVAPLGVGGGGAGGAGSGPRPGIPSAPRTPGAPRNGQPAPKADRQNPPAFSASNGAPPASFRAGYGNYLRTAGVGEMMVVAIPGVTGILVLTGAGGLLGYRQARAGRAVRASGTARFMG